MKYDFVIKNGYIVDFELMEITKKDVLVRNGKIEAVKESIDACMGNVIDASGKYVLPGLIDEHTHLN